MLEVHALLEWHRVRVNIHMHSHPVSAPSCALLGLILCIHPDRLTDAPIDSTSTNEHTERLAGVLYSEHEHAAKCVKMTNMCKQAGSQQPQKY